MLCLVLANKCELLLSIECAGGAAAPCRQLLVLCWRRVKTRDRSCVECIVPSCVGSGVLLSYWWGLKQDSSSSH